MLKLFDVISTFLKVFFCKRTEPPWVAIIQGTVLAKVGGFRYSWDNDLRVQFVNLKAYQTSKRHIFQCVSLLDSVLQISHWDYCKVISRNMFSCTWWASEGFCWLMFPFVLEHVGHLGNTLPQFPRWIACLFSDAKRWGNKITIDESSLLHRPTGRWDRKNLDLSLLKELAGKAAGEINFQIEGMVRQAISLGNTSRPKNTNLVQRGVLYMTVLHSLYDSDAGKPLFLFISPVCGTNVSLKHTEKSPTSTCVSCLPLWTWRSVPTSWVSLCSSCRKRNRTAEDLPVWPLDCSSCLLSSLPHSSWALIDSAEQPMWGTGHRFSMFAQKLHETLTILVYSCQSHVKNAA